MWYDVSGQGVQAAQAWLKAGVNDYDADPSTGLLGELDATLLNSGIDFVAGFLRLPQMLGHLGEGTECFWDHPSWSTLPGLVSDIAVAGAAVGFVGPSGFGAVAEGEAAEGGEVAAAESSTEGAECAQGACFVAGTPVRLADGSTRAIECVRPGDRVQARDPRTGQVVTARVTRTFVRAVDHTVVLTLPGGEQIETTETHPFWVEGRGWMPAGELGIGTQILTRAGPGLGLARIERRWQPARVYNFEVEGAHCYFVGSAGGGLCVHNTCDPKQLLIVDEQLPAALARMLREEGYNALHETEAFGGKGIADEQINEVLEQVDGKIITKNVKDFPGRAIGIEVNTPPKFANILRSAGDLMEYLRRVHGF